jgi:hypothetical protein
MIDFNCSSFTITTRMTHRSWHYLCVLTCCTWHLEYNPGLRDHPRTSPRNKGVLCLYLHRLAFLSWSHRQTHQDQCPIPQILTVIPQVLEPFSSFGGWIGAFDVMRFPRVVFFEPRVDTRSFPCDFCNCLFGEPAMSSADSVRTGICVPIVGRMIPVLAGVPGWGFLPAWCAEL